MGHETLFSRKVCERRLADVSDANPRRPYRVNLVASGQSTPVRVLGSLPPDYPDEARWILEGIGPRQRVAVCFMEFPDGTGFAQDDQTERMAAVVWEDEAGTLNEVLYLAGRREDVPLPPPSSR